MRKLYFLISFLVIFISCDKDSIVAPNVDTIAGELPLLNGGTKIGTIIGFNPSNPQSTTDSINARWNEAVNNGMTVARLQIDWAELEPQPNVFDTNALEEQLIEFKNQNLQTFLLISAYDSEGPEIPEDLQGLKFDNPVLIERFNNLMDWVIPMLVQYDGYIISITNEADNSFGEIPNLHNEILSFLKEVRPHIHSINEKMAVTVTIAEGSLDSDKPGITEIIAECDVACWNFYGSAFEFELPYYTAQTENQIKNDIHRMLEVSGEKNIVIQELGMHSGSDNLDSSEEIQRKFFQTFFQEMQNEKRLRAAYIFQLVDWSPEVTAIFTQIFEDEGMSQGFIDAFAETLETAGLIQYSNGCRKPAWDEFIYWLNEFE